MNSLEYEWAYVLKSDSQRENSCKKYFGVSGMTTASAGANLGNLILKEGSLHFFFQISYRNMHSPKF